MDPTFDATFTLTPPAPVTFTEPSDRTVLACDYTNQAGVDAAFNTWLADVLAQAAVSGGCAPVVTNNSATDYPGSLHRWYRNSNMVR